MTSPYVFANPEAAKPTYTLKANENMGGKEGKLSKREREREECERVRERERGV
jgi:hypothetical protein